jgi:hypothetical protein
MASGLASLQGKPYFADMQLIRIVIYLQLNAIFSLKEDTIQVIVSAILVYQLLESVSFLLPIS